MKNKTVGQLLTARLAEEGLSQTTIAERVGASRSMISVVCGDGAALPVGLAAKIGQELGLAFGEQLLIAQADARKARDLTEYNELVKEESE